MKPGMSVERKIQRLNLQIEFYKARPDKKKWRSAIQRRKKVIAYLKENGNINWKEIADKFKICEV